MNSRGVALIRGLLIVIAAVTGMLISARALFGPFRLIVPINNPLNLQCIFGLAATLAFVCARPEAGEKKSVSDPLRLEPGLRPALLSVACLVLIGVTAFAKNLSDFFLSDDFYLIELAAKWRNGYFPELYKHGGGREFFRPVGGLALAFTYFLSGVSPFLWHLASLMMHLANSVLVWLLAIRLSFGRRAAFAASALFIIHGTRPEAVTWVAGRFDPLSTLFVLIGLLSFAHYCATRRGRYYLVALASMSLGTLCKESAFVFPILAGLTMLAVSGPPRKVLLWTAPFYVGGGVIFTVRWFALGGLGGYVPEKSGDPAIISAAVQVAKALALRLWSALYFPLNWSLEPGLSVAALCAVAVAAMVFLIATVSLRRRTVLFSVAFVVIASLPAVSQLLIGSDLQKSRLLYLPSIGFCLLLGYALSAIQPVSLRTPALVAVLVFHLACLQHNLWIWGRVASTAESTCSQIVSDLPPSVSRVIIRGMPGSLEGVYFLQNGLKPCLDLKAGRTVNLEVDDAGVSEISAETAVFDWDQRTSTLRNVP